MSVWASKRERVLRDLLNLLINRLCVDFVFFAIMRFPLKNATLFFFFGKSYRKRFEVITYFCLFFFRGKTK